MERLREALQRHPLESMREGLALGAVETLEPALHGAGFKRAARVDEPGEPVPDLVLYRDRGGRRIDVLFAHTTLRTRRPRVMPRRLTVSSIRR